jgi:Ras-related protein Rab-1A
MKEENEEKENKEDDSNKNIENNTDDNNENNKEAEEEYKMVRLNDFETNYDFIFRICLIGDVNVGKTSLLTRFCDHSFKETYYSTIGVDFRVVTLKYNNSILKLHIWDTAGQERFKSIALNYFKSSHGFIFVYDITAPNTFKSIKNWMDLAFANSDNVGINFLVGNKSDLEEDRKIQKDDGEKFAKEKKLIFFESSAKTNENVEKIYMYFAYKLVNYFSENKDKYINSDITKNKLKLNAEEIKIEQKEEKNCAC